MGKLTANALAVVRRRSEPEDPTLPAILEFQWPSTAIVNAPVPPLARGIVWIVASMVVVLVGAMGLISVDQVVTTRGIVVSQNPTILVQPLDTAIVRSIAASLIRPVDEMPSPNRTIRENESTTRKPPPVGQAISRRQLLVPRSSAA